MQRQRVTTVTAAAVTCGKQDAACLFGSLHRMHEPCLSFDRSQREDQINLRGIKLRVAAAVAAACMTALAVTGAANASTATTHTQPAHTGTAIMSGHGDGTFTTHRDIPGAAAKVEGELASGKITKQQADAIPVSATYVVTVKNSSHAGGRGHGTGGDPTVTAEIYENSIVNIPLWTFRVTQSFDYDGNNVTWLSPLSWSGTAVHYIWWSINNESASTSNPSTGTWHVQTYANAVFNYCAYWVLCSETSYAEAWLDFYGDGYWSWNADYSNSF